MKYKLFHIFSSIFFCFAFIFIFTIFLWINYPYKILEFKDPLFPVINKNVAQGGTLKYVSSYCKYMNLSAKTTRSFVNGIIFTTPSTTTDRKTGCNKIIVFVFVPKELPIGPMHIEMLYEYHPNPLRTIILKHSTEVFNVVESTTSSELRLQGY